jgi:flavodoxin
VYPNWWGTIPMPVASFLESYDLAGKTLIPICTHLGSKFGNSIEDIKKLAPKAKLGEGFQIRGLEDENSLNKNINDLLKNNNLKK